MADYRDQKDKKSERRAGQKPDTEDGALLLIIVSGITP